VLIGSGVERYDHRAEDRCGRKKRRQEQKATAEEDRGEEAILALAQPVTLLLHASRNPLHTWAKRVVRSRVVTFLTWPPFVLILYAATIAGTHLTGLMSLVLTNPALHNAEHALYLVVGYLFFLPILGTEPIRWRLSYPIRFVMLVVAMPVDTFTGLVLGTENTPIKGMTAAVRPPGSPGPVADLHAGGAVMWIGGDAIMLGFMMLVFLMWAHADRVGTLSRGWLEAVRTASFETLVAPPAPARPAGTPEPAQDAAAPGADAPEPAVAGARGTIDDDDHLEAYNAYLARLNQPGHRPGR